jgi:hypothetical protein
MHAKKTVTATILGNPDVALPCQIVNFSKSGMCIAVRWEIPEGNAVKVDWDGHFLVGRVRRVSKEFGEYSIGLELLYCSQWKGAVEPVLTSQ